MERLAERLVHHLDSWARDARWCDQASCRPRAGGVSIGTEKCASFGRIQPDSIGQKIAAIARRSPRVPRAPRGAAQDLRLDSGIRFRIAGRKSRRFRQVLTGANVPPASRRPRPGCDRLV